MQEHPVPHNILEIEFKLFGSFSVRQFARIMLGCAVALGIYILKLPTVVSVPLIGLSIGLGIGSAMISNFDAKLSTLVSAILVSPRYVWRKGAKVPDYLQPSSAPAVRSGAAGSPTKVNVRDLEIEELLQSRSARRAALEEPVAAAVPTSTVAPDLTAGAPQLAQVITEEQPPQAEPAPAAEPVTVAAAAPLEPEPSKELPVAAAAVESAPDLTATATAPASLSAEQILNRLNELKTELGRAQKTGSNTDSITNEINQLYKKLQELAPDKFNQAVVETTTPAAISTNYLYGIVVDRKGSAVKDARVKVVDGSGAVYAEGVSGSDGRFETAKPLPYGEYVVTVEAGRYKFEKFKVSVTDKRLPAYKFRAK